MLRAREYLAWGGFLYVHATLIRDLDQALQAEHQLQLSDYEALLFLSHAPDKRLRMSELANRVVLSLSGISHLVARLERGGLVIRQRASEDGRGNYALLTDLGQARLDAAHQTHLAGVRRAFLDHFSPSELDHLAVFWERLAPGFRIALRQVHGTDV
jgi:DNA-binding MarR family transcriptional regulator